MLSFKPPFFLCPCKAHPVNSLFLSAKYKDYSITTLLCGNVASNTLYKMQQRKKKERFGFRILVLKQFSTGSNFL